MSKLPHVGTTIFTVMSQLAHEVGAINLSQGFPNFPVDERLTQILSDKATSNIHQYMPMPGSLELRLEIAQIIAKQYSRTVSAESEILVTAGATQGLFTAFMALIDRGDEVIVLDPSYDSYEPAIVLSGGTPIRVGLDSSYRPDWDAIRSACSGKTKMIVTNNPHNPSGRVWAAEDFDQLEDLMEAFPQMYWLSDEVYEFIHFQGKHISANHRTRVRDRAIICSSFGKTYHITGWKIGYIVAPDYLMRELKKVHQFNVFCVNSVAQASLASYLPQVDVNALGAFYQEKRDLFSSLLAKSRFQLLPCEGTYFQVADYSEISDLSDVEFCRKMAVDSGVAAIPISVFNATKEDRKHIRFCFAKDTETLIKAGEKLCKI